MLRKNDLSRLLSQESRPSVSLYLPTHKAGPAMREDPIRLKTLLREAEAQIDHDPTARKILEPAWSLVVREGEWQHMKQGLAIFLSPDHQEFLKLDHSPEAVAVVRDSFYIKPLLPALDDGQRFYLLILDRKDPRLYLCSRAGFERVQHEVMDQSFAKLVAKTELQADVGFHSASASGARGGAGTVQFHSQGESPDDYRKTELDQFALGIAKAVNGVLKEETVPLVLAGEPTLLGLYRTHDRYGHTLDESLTHAGVEGEDSAIEKEVRKLVAPHLDRPRRRALEKLEELQGKTPGLVALNHEDILRDADSGRVATLLVAEDADLWAQVVADDRTRLTAPGADGAVDLIERMAMRTLRHGGDVIMVSRGKIPGDAHAAAILRF